MTTKKFVVSLNIYNYTVREPDPSDSWGIGDDDGYLESISARVIRDWEDGHYNYPGSESYSPEWESEPGSQVIAVYATYTSGCTFGRTGLQGSILGVFPMSEYESAEELLRKAEDPKSEMYKPWIGYFEELQELTMGSVWIRV